MTESQDDLEFGDARVEGSDKRELELHVAGHPVEVYDDEYSNRLRCDHPDVSDGRELGESLIQKAQDLGRNRVVLLAHERLADDLTQTGMVLEATIPGFYGGDADCVVMGAALDEARSGLGEPQQVQQIAEQVEAIQPLRRHAHVATERACAEDAGEIAELLGETFPQYPTPSHDPKYVEAQIEDGVPFRLIREEGKVITCASADLVREARTAELTYCATRPSARGRGLMQAVLTDLMDDLRDMDYPTAFTLARATIPGVNLAFARLGFTYCGTMGQSCRIGSGIEDMNVFSVRLEEPVRACA